MNLTTMEIILLGTLQENLEIQKNLGNFFSKIELHNVEFDILEEIFFESVVLNDWNLAEQISSKILEKDEYNFSANLFDFTINFLSKRQNNLTENLKKIDISQFDLNFIKFSYYGHLISKKNKII